MRNEPTIRRSRAEATGGRKRLLIIDLVFAVLYLCAVLFSNRA